MKRLLLLFMVTIAISACSKEEAFDAEAENEKLRYIYFEGVKYSVTWDGMYVSGKPETYWDVYFSANNTFSIYQSPETVPGVITNIEYRTPYTLERGKIIPTGKSYHYTYSIEKFNENNYCLKIKSSTSSIEHICVAGWLPVD